jgi:formylmethanofuran dehydrogenase subunit E
MTKLEKDNWVNDNKEEIVSYCKETRDCEIYKDQYGKPLVILIRTDYAWTIRVYYGEDLKFENHHEYNFEKIHEMIQTIKQRDTKLNQLIIDASKVYFDASIISYIS